MYGCTPRNLFGACHLFRYQPCFPRYLKAFFPARRPEFMEKQEESPVEPLMGPVGFDWDVVVVGFWNPAILTPAGIWKRLFELEQGTPVELEVPIDGLAPYRVSHEEITVTAERGSHIVCVIMGQKRG